MSAGWIIKFSDDKRSSATFSECERYRYTLSRNFSTLFDSQVRWLNVIMLNPSTADQNANDPTVARQGKRAQMLGCQGLMVTNIFAWRDTDPHQMRQIGDPVGPENDRYIIREASCAIASGGLVVAAWGANGAHLQRGAHVKRLLKSAGIPLHYLRLTKGGEPEHPLYVGYAVEPKRWA